MIPIQELTATRLQERLNSLSDALKTAANSEANSDVVIQVCHHHHLADEEKVLIVQQLTALVLFGFIHSYDLAREINDALALNNPKLAKSIADELDAKLFAPLKAELEVNYQPLTPQPLKITTDIQKPALPQTVLKSPLVSPSPTVPTPKSQSTPVPPPATVFPSAPSIQKPPLQPTEQKIQSLPNASAPGPMLIHQETGAKPISDIPSLRTIPPADQRLGEIKPEKPAGQPAKIEMGFSRNF
ncbi:MAG: hypothetical protein AAB967_03290, partial [Patescibacteria group bacterium]